MLHDILVRNEYPLVTVANSILCKSINERRGFIRRFRNVNKIITAAIGNAEKKY